MSLKYCSVLGLVVVVFFHTTINAQSLERKVIASGGASASGSLQLDYTIGEIAITTVAINTTVLTQGFHQPQVAIISGNNIFPYLILYPNPTPGNATARFVLSAPATMTVSIYNMLGQMISSEEITYISGEMQYPVKVGKLAQGIYMIKFTINDGSQTVTKELLKVD